MEKAFVIIGTSREFGEVKPMAGFLFGTKHPNIKQVKALGFNVVQQVEECSTNGDAPKDPTFYCYDRSPAVKEVVIAKVSIKGKTLKLGEKEIKQIKKYIQPMLCVGLKDGT